MSKIFSRPTDGRHLRTDPKKMKYFFKKINLFYKNKKKHKIHHANLHFTEAEVQFVVVAQIRHAAAHVKLNKKNYFFCILIYFSFVFLAYLLPKYTQNFIDLHTYKINWML